MSKISEFLFDEGVVDALCKRYNNDGRAGYSRLSKISESYYQSRVDITTDKISSSLDKINFELKKVHISTDTRNALNLIKKELLK